MKRGNHRCFPYVFFDYLGPNLSQGTVSYL